jgi:hypothetical protein
VEFGLEKAGRQGVLVGEGGESEFGGARAVVAVVALGVFFVLVLLVFFFAEIVVLAREGWRRGKEAESEQGSAPNGATGEGEDAAGEQTGHRRAPARVGGGMIVDPTPKGKEGPGACERLVVRRR